MKAFPKKKGNPAAKVMASETGQPQRKPFQKGKGNKIRSGAHSSSHRGLNESPPKKKGNVRAFGGNWSALKPQ